MATKTKPQLKSMFKGGDEPTTEQYRDLIDSAFNLTDTAAQSLTSDITTAGSLTITGGNNAGVKFLIAGAANVVTAADSGKIIVFNVADATLCTLPEPQIGLKYTFVTKILATGDHEIQAKNNGHGFLGGVTVTSTTAAKADFFSANANGADDFITQTGGTNGGGPGSIITITGIADTSGAGCWLVAGNLGAVGSTTATPFATS
tara:strand:- start:58 stop:669 length:612 start_codon:yes stop_codon:yes gene_type:complete